MRRINLAYEILGDPNKRAEYDRTRGAQQSQRAETPRYASHREPPRSSRTTDKSDSPPPPRSSRTTDRSDTPPPRGTESAPPGTRNGKSARISFIQPLVVIALAVVAVVVVAVIVDANRGGGGNDTPSVAPSLPSLTPTARDSGPGDSDNAAHSSSGHVYSPTHTRPVRYQNPYRNWKRLQCRCPRPRKIRCDGSHCRQLSRPYVCPTIRNPD